MVDAANSWPSCHHVAITVHSIRSIKAVFLQIHKYKLTSALLPEGFASTFKKIVLVFHFQTAGNVVGETIPYRNLVCPLYP